MKWQIKYIVIQKEENYLKGLSKAEFIKKIAYFFSEINALHPFREGNGRSQREFIRSLTIYNGYMISFANISEIEMIEASQKSFIREYEMMEHLFTKCIY